MQVEHKSRPYEFEPSTSWLTVPLADHYTIVHRYHLNRLIFKCSHFAMTYSWLCGSLANIHLHLRFWFIDFAYVIRALPTHAHTHAQPPTHTHIAISGQYIFVLLYHLHNFKLFLFASSNVITACMTNLRFKIFHVLHFYVRSRSFEVD